MTSDNSSPTPPLTPADPSAAATHAAPPTSADAVTSSPAPAAPASQGPADAAACGQQLKQLFPALFAGAPKPLKLRIQADIQERAPGVFSKQVLSAFLRRYTGSTSYLIATSKATHRFDLDGQPAGELSDEHRQVARDELTRRRANQDARREQEEQGRRQRSALLRDFQNTTLTPANFCALKGIPLDQLDALLAQAREEAQQRPPQEHRAGPRRDDRRQDPREGRREPRRDQPPRRGGKPAR